jgi:hypothetical protein
MFDLKTTVEIYALDPVGRAELWGIGKWLEFVGDQPSIYFACDGPPDAPVPVYSQEDIDVPDLVLPSIGELVAAWIRAVERGEFVTDPDGR